MNLTGLHFLLTYTCNYECDHCFAWGSPFASGTFTLKEIREVCDEAEKIGTVQDAVSYIIEHGIAEDEP